MTRPKPAYFYEHVNGEIIRRPAIVVEMGGGPGDYFNSPFVRKWWREGDQPPKNVTPRIRPARSPASEGG